MELTGERSDGLWVLRPNPETYAPEPNLPEPNLPEPYERVVVELAGATAVWPLDAAPGSWPELTLTDPGEADWLWRWTGIAGHVELMGLIARGDRFVVEVDPEAEALDLVRRLAYGHWLRRWWPTSPSSDLPRPDPVLVALELAVLTVRCEAWLGDGYDSEAAALLAGVSAQQVAAALAPLPRATELLDELTEDLVPHWSDQEITAVRDGSLPVPPRRDDYALAAGAGADRPLSDEGVAQGRCSIDWAGVPPDLLDAADGSIRWTVEATGTVTIRAAVRLLPEADPSGLTVWFDLPGEFDLTRTLDAAGQVETELPITPAQAWGRSWSDFRIGIGPRRGGDHAASRERVRRFARARLSTDPELLAEQAAADEQW